MLFFIDVYFAARLGQASGPVVDTEPGIQLVKLDMLGMVGVGNNLRPTGELLETEPVLSPIQRLEAQQDMASIVAMNKVPEGTDATAASAAAGRERAGALSSPAHGPRTSERTCGAKLSRLLSCQLSPCLLRLSARPSWGSTQNLHSDLPCKVKGKMWAASS